MYSNNENDTKTSYQRDCFMPVQKTPPKVIRIAEPRGEMRMDSIRGMPFFGKRLDELDKKASDETIVSNKIEFV